jgi:murein DD-endopeptidase MepM/ murein hydrolase activator NlpD
MESPKLLSPVLNRCCLLLACVALAAPPAIGKTAGSSTTLKATRSWAVRRQPAQLVNGSPVLIEVVPPVRLTALSATWLGHDVFFSYDPATKTWYGMAGVSLETRPGIYALELKGRTAKSAEVAFSQRIKVQAAKYPSIAVTVAKKFTEPSKEQLQRIQQDKAVKHDVFEHTDTEREWSGNFLRPVSVPVADVFGTRRTFNGKVQSMHQGLDFAAPTGTPVLAANSGTILLAGPLYFEGNCVVIDHGQGLLTLYLHLSDVQVKPGERIARGQQIGLSGGTGRATGPHLHLAVRWQGVYLNPATLLNLKLP